MCSVRVGQKDESRPGWAEQDSSRLHHTLRTAHNVKLQIVHFWNFTFNIFDSG